MRIPIALMRIPTELMRILTVDANSLELMIRIPTELMRIPTELMMRNQIVPQIFATSLIKIKSYTCYNSSL